MGEGGGVSSGLWEEGRWSDSSVMWGNWGWKGRVHEGKVMVKYSKVSPKT